MSPLSKSGAFLQNANNSSSASTSLDNNDAEHANSNAIAADRMFLEDTGKSVLEWTALCTGLLLCLPFLHEWQSQEDSADNEMSFDKIFIRTVESTISPDGSDGVCRSADAKAALSALVLWSSVAGGFSYFLVPKVGKINSAADGRTEICLQPFKGGYAAFKYDSSLLHSVLEYQRSSLDLANTVTELLSSLSDVAFDDDEDGSIAETALALIDDVQMRLDDFHESQDCKAAFKLFGSETCEDKNEVEHGIVSFVFDVEDDASFANMLTQLNAAMFAYVSPHELLAAAFRPDLSSFAQNIFHPNISAIINLHSRVVQWVSSTISSAASSSQASLAPCLAGFIRVCRRFRVIGNFQGLISVISGIQNAIASTEGFNFDGIGQEEQDCFRRLQNLCSATDRYKVIHHHFLMSPTIFCFCNHTT